jgi:Protein of unknown function (DUF2934)
MAKRNTPRAQAEDTATVPRPPKHRRSTSTVGAPPSDAIGEQAGVLGSEPTEDDIRRRAYERYLERGAEHGMDFEDWLAAERDLRSRASEG